MVFKRYTTKQQTMTAATDSATIQDVRGKLVAIAIQTSASNTFWISTQAGPISQDLYGATGSYITVASNQIVYPRAKIVESDNTDGAAGDNLWTQFVVDGDITINVASGTAADTWTVTVYLED